MRALSNAPRPARGARSRTALVLALGCALLVSVCLMGRTGDAKTNPMDLLVPPASTGAVHRIVYGPDPLEFAELRVPPGPGPFPVAIVVHGGCWQSVIDGLPRSAVSLDLVRPLAAGLTAAGYATYSVEYRRVGDPGGAWPGTFLDVGAAADHLRAIATAYHLDLTRTIAVGHSAGGHLVSWLAIRSRLAPSSALYAPDPLPIHGVLNVDGPSDLHFTPAALAGFCPGAVESLIGGPVAVYPERYRDASAGSFLPTHVPSEVLVSGAFGPGWDPYVTQLAAAATAAGDRVGLHHLPASNHFDLINPKASAWRQVLASANALRDGPPPAPALSP